MMLELEIGRRLLIGLIWLGMILLVERWWSYRSRG